MLKKAWNWAKGLFVGVTAVVVTSPAFAAIDITEATTGITDAKAGILAIIGALLALSTAIFGIVKIYNFISKKAGG